MDRLTRTVREQVALGRLLPLGAPGDTAWITEAAAVRVLRAACTGLPGVRVGKVALLLGQSGDNGSGGGPSAAAPVGALPHVPLRIEAAFEASVDEPLPLAADRLREALGGAARGGLGLTVEAVDLEVVGLLDGVSPTGGPHGGTDDEGEDAAEEPGGDSGGDSGGATLAAVGGGSEAVRAAALAVPGVAGLTRRLAGLGSGVRVQDTGADEDGTGTAGRRVQVQLAVAPGHVALTVAREVAAAVTTAAAEGAKGPVATAVVVTDAG